MIILFRTDSSINIGVGHLMRCLTLAEEAVTRDIKPVFICQKLQGNFIQVIKDKGFDVIEVEVNKESKITLSDLAHYNWLEGDFVTDAQNVVEIIQQLKQENTHDDISLVVDSYALDIHWENIIKPHVDKLIVIDDLADREHNCDIIIDHNLYNDFEARYDGLVPKSCLKLLGANYCILRQQFQNLQPRIRNEIKNIFVFFGGVDQFNYSEKSIDIIKEIENEHKIDFNVDIVLASSGKYKENVRNKAIKYGYNIYENVENMAELMLKADLAIGAGGTTTWERAACALPCITISIADNQDKLAKDGGSHNILLFIDNINKVKQKLQDLLIKPDILKAISETSLEKVKSLGAIILINSILLSYRNMMETDKDRILEWRNSERIRLFFHNSDIIKKEDHYKWFDNIPPTSKYYIFEYKNKPFGIVYFTNINNGTADWGFYIGEENITAKLGLTMCNYARIIASNSLNLDRINAEILNNNIRSIQIHKSLGFEFITEHNDTLKYSLELI